MCVCVCVRVCVGICVKYIGEYNHYVATELEDASIYTTIVKFS